MIIEKNNIFYMENQALRIGINTEKNGNITEFTCLYGQENMNQNKELFIVEIRNKVISSSEFELVSIETAEDKKHELLTVYLEKNDEDLKAKVHFLNDKKSTITVLWQFYDGYKYGYPNASWLKLPFLADLSVAGEEQEYFSENCVVTKKGEDIIKRPPESFYVSDIRLPLVICENKNGQETNGFSVEFVSEGDLNDEGAVQNVSCLLARSIKTREDLRNHKIAIHPDQSFNDTVELRISGISKGWEEAFFICKENWRKRYDLSEYKRQDLQWMNECVINDFAFLYGRESFDHETNRVNVKKIIEDGKKFGGYDSVTIWNQYPRLGVDKRSQWDFYDDFPGGRKALKEMVDEFHAHGIKVLLPYIPWDRGYAESTETMGDEFAKIISDTGADGYQLDTCKDLPLSFRKKLDKIRPGLLLQTQSHPYKKRPIEFITSSWDEFWYTDPMPEINLFRFMIPEHIAPVISRWLRMEDKDVLIKRCIFNAAPMVIWQDIFGRMLIFSDEQKEKIKEWKKLYLKHREIYQSQDALPLYPVNEKHVYCNRFRNDKGTQIIYSIYNENDTEKVIKIPCNCSALVEVLTDKGMVEKSEDGYVQIFIPSKEVVQVFVKEK